MIKRVFLFGAVNILVVLTISFLIQILGLPPYLSSRGINYEALLVFCALYGFAGSFISLQISRAAAKWSLGVHVIDPQRPNGAAESYLVEKVRALCSRAGMHTLPEIGIYHSPEVNAFATGPSKNRSLLAVSTGMLERMDDRAVEGVLGHEISHIVNGDMVTMTLIQGTVNAFVMFLSRAIAFAIDSALRSRDDDGRGGLGYFAQIAVVMLLEVTLMLLAMPLINWFSRRREYKADFGSAQLAGRETMIHALKSLAPAAGLVDNRSPALATLKINGGGRGLWASLVSSHPPLEDRIRALQEARL